MTPKRFLELIVAAELEARSYSGRGMFGRSCIGIDLERGESAVGAALKIAAACDTIEEVEYLYRALKDAREDSMGLGTIVYWPDMEWPKTSD